MAENIETLAIQIDLNSNPVIKALDQVAGGFNRITGNAEKAGKTADAATARLGGIGRAGISIGEQTQRGIAQAQKSLSRFDGEMKKTFNRLKGYLAPLALIGIGRKIFAGFTEEAIALDEVSKKSKMAIADLDAWSRANAAAGGSSEAFAKALGDWSEKTGRTGYEFIRLAESLNGLSGAQQEAHLKYLGLTRESASVFLQGNKEMNALVSQYRSMALTPQDAENARKFRMQWQITQAEIKNIGVLLAKSFMPVLAGVTEGFRKTAAFFREHGEVIKIALTGIATAAVLAFGKKSVLNGVAFLKSPLGVLLAAIAGISLVLEDVIYFTKGYGSALEKMLASVGMSREDIENLRSSFGKLGTNIAGIVDKCKPAVKAITEICAPIMVKSVETLVATFGTLIAGINALISDSPEARKAFGDMLDAWMAKFGDLIDSVGELIGKMFTNAKSLALDWCSEVGGDIADAFGGAWETVKDKFDSLIVEPITNAFKNVWDTVANGFEEVVLRPIRAWLSTGLIGKVTGMANDYDENGRPKTPMNPNSGQVVANQSKNTNISNTSDVDIVNNNNVTINGNATAEAISGGLNQASNQAVARSRDLVAYAQSGVMADF